MSVGIYFHIPSLLKEFSIMKKNIDTNTLSRMEGVRESWHLVILGTKRSKQSKKLTTYCLNGPYNVHKRLIC
jgi:hypothetical protein